MVIHEQSALVLTRDSKPQAVLTSYDDYRRLKQAEEKLAREEFFRLVKDMRSRNKHISEKELIKDLEIVEKEFRRKKNGKSRH